MLPMSLTVFQKESSGMTMPLDVVSPPRASETAISRPPTTTNGIMYETPFMSAL
ncbi:hypothetical protein SANTM175S_01046 [Streptomyces antimycoticus]